MTTDERQQIADEIADRVMARLAECDAKCPLGLTTSDAMKWQGMLKVAGIVGVAAAWTVVAAVAAGLCAALWAGVRHLVAIGAILRM